MRVGWIMFVAGCASRYERILALTGDPITGQILYEADCAACHGVDGQGASGTALTETLPTLTGTEILMMIDDGAGNMPAYRGQYTQQEMADLLEYITLEFQ
jgi:mono/diheme cytochrome c family protein